MAQGANATAKLNGSELIHKTDEGPIETPICLKTILEGTAKDVKLEADDILFVPHGVSHSPGMGLQMPNIQLDLPLILPPPQGGRIFQ